MPDVKLSGPELEDRSRALATTIETIIDVEREKKSTLADYSSRLKDLKDEAARLSRIVRTGVEFRDDQLQMFPASKAVN